MTPLQIAREQCANFQPDRSCLGAWIGDDCTIPYYSPKAKCVLLDGKGCKYFEECVLPMDRSALPHVARQAWEDAKRSYYRDTGRIRVESGRVCPECGRELEKRKRYCYVCAQKRRRKTYRESKSQRGGHISTVKPFSTPENIGDFGGQKPNTPSRDGFDQSGVVNCGI